MDYVHFNPVKHGLVVLPADWRYSTVRSCAERGLAWTGSGGEDIPAAEPGG